MRMHTEGLLKHLRASGGSASEALKPQFRSPGITGNHYCTNLPILFQPSAFMLNQQMGKETRTPELSRETLVASNITKQVSCFTGKLLMNIHYA